MILGQRLVGFIIPLCLLGPDSFPTPVLVDASLARSSGMAVCSLSTLLGNGYSFGLSLEFDGL